MKTAIAMIFIGAGWLLQIFGGFCLIGLFVYGVYTIFANSIPSGLMLIGASVILGWAIRFASMLLMSAGAGVASIGSKMSKEN